MSFRAKRGNPQRIGNDTVLASDILTTSLSLSCGRNKTRVEDADAFLCAGGFFKIDLGGKLIPGYRCSYSAAHYSDSLFDAFGIAYSAVLSNAVPRRRSDYLAGRVCAKHVLTFLGVGSAAGDVGVGRNRAPVWPEGVVGSITHSGGVAACIGTTDPGVGGLGIDVEEEIAIDVANEIKNWIVDAQEDVLIRTNFESYSQGLTVVFSAKEAIYKAAHRFIERFLELSAVELVDVDRNSIAFSLREPLADHLRIGCTITVNYSIEGKNIQTAACLAGRV